MFRFESFWLKLSKVTTPPLILVTSNFWEQGEVARTALGLAFERSLRLEERGGHVARGYRHLWVPRFVPLK